MNNLHIRTECPKTYRKVVLKQIQISILYHKCSNVKNLNNIYIFFIALGTTSETM